MNITGCGPGSMLLSLMLSCVAVSAGAAAPTPPHGPLPAGTLAHRLDPDAPPHLGPIQHQLTGPDRPQGSDGTRGQWS